MIDLERYKLTPEEQAVVIRCVTERRSLDKIWREVDGVIDNIADNSKRRIQECMGKLFGVVGTTRGHDLGYEFEPDCLMARYEILYGRWDHFHKQRCSWEEVKRRLMVRKGRLLKLAAGLRNGGVLFGLDDEGNPLAADGGPDGIPARATYVETRAAVLFKDKAGKKPTGYEMFSYGPPNTKSREIADFERFTGQPFVFSPDGKEWRSSWLESSDKPAGQPRAIFWNPDDAPSGNPYAYWSLGRLIKTHIDGAENDSVDYGRCVRRLLRLK